MMLTLAFVLSLHGGVSDEHPGGDRWFGADKAKHFFLAAFVQSAWYSALRTAHVNNTAALSGATAVAGAVSVGKEVHDRRSGSIFSVRDLTWDAAGMAAASSLLTRTRR
jgi:uncharacterized protein YfiM (DUF2279 family)